MKRIILLFSIVMGMALAACAAPPSSDQTVEEGDGPIVTVYHPPT